MIKILNHYHEYSEFETPISKIIAVNKQRNDVAHGLVVISVEQKKLDELVNDLKELVITVYSDINASLYQKYFDYYDIKNRELISCIK
ncbi:CRISPR-associated family protein [Streptococcus sanguinis]|nr:CRISPR-associated family protein [Streptococcus sanguinis]